MDVKTDALSFPLSTDYTVHGCLKEAAMKALQDMPAVRKLVQCFDGTVRDKLFVEATYKNRPVLIDQITGTVYDGFLLRPFYSSQLQIIGDYRGDLGRFKKRLPRHVPGNRRKVDETKQSRTDL